MTTPRPRRALGRFAWGVAGAAVTLAVLAVVFAPGPRTVWIAVPRGVGFYGRDLPFQTAEGLPIHGGDRHAALVEIPGRDVTSPIDRFRSWVTPGLAIRMRGSYCVATGAGRYRDGKLEFAFAEVPLTPATLAEALDLQSQWQRVVLRFKDGAYPHRLQSIDCALPLPR